MSQSVSAWWLKTGGAYSLAVGQHELIEVVEAHEVIDLPCGPVFCRQVVSWREEILPLVQLSYLDGSGPDGQIQYFAIFAWQDAEGEALQHAAIALTSMPESILVNDQQIMEWSEGIVESVWHSWLMSCIEYQGEVVLLPALDRLLKASS